jgi:hypothetical protein
MRCWLSQISMGGGIWASEGEGEKKKKKTRVVGGGVWAGGGLGWIVATPGGRIFFFFGSPKKSPEVGDRW